ncbi:Uncharacterised protein [Escherichia coli]|uniref:Uncharacterized protein n=1 Tax=Escherichia coli TaxID=562 RepID=A0AAX2KD60_ECOLX|nr:hypothetical protein BJJ90_15475 [Escherichia coli]EIF85676.1 hypothetical protein ESMG_02106 [Escherichia coli M919]EAC1529517.1 hypothetical protein [Escherichia coli]EEV9926992.1 hypothetical protein [Escherichia coli]EEV9947764.1 hypothetical protein [Escherichia coli]
MQKLIAANCKYAVIRCDDMSVVAEMDCFPDGARAVWHRKGNMLRVRALRADERIVSKTVLREIVYQFMRT